MVDERAPGAAGAGEAKRYDAFVSYSHAADGELAPALQAALQRFTRTWRQRRALEVFRDDTGLGVNPDLWASITTALDRSDWFVHLCSPAAAESVWVGREIERWVATRGPDRLLPVLTEGTFTWDETAGDIDLARSTAAHPALAGVFRAEPRHLDLSWARTATDLTLRNARFRSEIAGIAAPIHGRDRDELEGEDVVRQRQVRRLVRGVVAVLVVLVLAASASAVVAVRNGREADRQRDEAEAQRTEAEKQRAEAELQARTATSQRLADLSRTAEGELGQLLAAQAHRTAPTTQATGAMIEALGGATDSGGTGVVGRLTGHDGEVVSVAHSRDGAHVVTVDAAGAVRVFTAAGGAVGDPAELDATDAEIVGTDVVAAATPEGVALLDLGAGTADRVVDVGGAVLRVARVGDGDLVAAGTESGGVALVGTDGEVVARADGAHTEPVRFVGASDDGSTLVSFGAASESEAPGEPHAGGTVVVHDPSDLAAEAEWTAEGGVLALAPDGATVAVAAPWTAPEGDAGSAVARVLDTATGALSTTLYTFEPYVPRAAAFTPSGQEVVVLTTGGVDNAPGQAFLTTLGGDRLATESFPTVIMESNRSVSVAPDGTSAVIGGSDPAAPLVTLGDDAFGAPVVLDGRRPTVPLSVSDTGMVTVTGDSQVGLAALATGAVELVVPSVGDQAAVSPDGSRLLTVEGLVDTATGEDVGDDPLPPPQLDVPPSFSVDGSRVTYVVRSPSDDEVAVVDLAAGTLVATGPAPAPLCTSGTSGAGEPYSDCDAHAAFVALSPDGTQVALRPPGPDGEVALEVVDVTDGWVSRATTTTEGGGPVAFSADGTELLVQAGGLVRRHDATTLEPSGSGRGTELTGRWEADGDALATVAECSVALTDPVSLRPVATIPVGSFVGEAGCESAVDATWVHRGATLLTAFDDCEAGDCRLRRWELDPDALAADLCSRTGRNLTADEWEQYLAGFAYERTCEEWPGGGTTGDAGDAPADAPPTTVAGSTSTTSPPPPTTAGPTTTTTAPATVADGEPVALEELLEGLYGDDPTYTYAGDCADVAPDAPLETTLCTSEIRRDGQELVVAVGAYESEVYAYHLLVEVGRGWVLTETYGVTGEADEVFPDWVLGDG